MFSVQAQAHYITYIISTKYKMGSRARQTFPALCEYEKANKKYLLTITNPL